MARKTRTQVVNEVLRRLRDDEVTGTQDTAYSKLVSDLVDQALSDVEMAWRWLELRTEFEITTIADTDLYSLTDFGEQYRIEEIYDSTTRTQIPPAPDWRFERSLELQTETTGPPQWWRISGVDANGDPQLQLFPTPTASLTISVYALVGQGLLATDSTKLWVPSKPVILRAWYLAAKERGEASEGEIDGLRSDANKAVQDAIAQDNINVNGGKNSDWHVE